VELARTDPSLLPLGLNVTYWDRLGWKDPYSVPAVTQRQYSARVGLDRIYTPQLVGDGRHQAIARARADTATVPVSLSVTSEGVRLQAGAWSGAAIDQVVARPEGERLALLIQAGIAALAAACQSSGTSRKSGAAPRSRSIPAFNLARTRARSPWLSPRALRAAGVR